LNYGNRNASSIYTNADLIKGYSTAVGSSVGVGLLMRYMLSGIANRSTGSKLVLINSVVATIASGTAGFLNTLSMRSKEMVNGVSISSDESLND